MQFLPPFGWAKRTLLMVIILHANEKTWSIALPQNNITYNGNNVQEGKDDVSYI